MRYKYLLPLFLIISGCTGFWPFGERDDFFGAYGSACGRQCQSGVAVQLLTPYRDDTGVYYLGTVFGYRVYFAVDFENVVIFSTVAAISRSLASTEVHAMCGVI